MRVRPARWGVGALAVLALLLTALIAPAGGAAPDAVNQERLDRTIRFLQNIQNRDGGYGGNAGAKSDFLFSAWVGLALAAAGINPQDQAKPGGTDLYSYLTGNAYRIDPDKITDYQRNLMIANAAGGDPRNYGGVDLVEAILSRQLANGSFRRARAGQYAGYNDTAFAILALAPIGGPEIRAANARAARWLIDRQSPSGGWGYNSNDSPSSDMTGAVLQAIRAAGIVEHDVESRAWEFVRSLQREGGGFAMSTLAPDANTASTAWVVQGMWATGIDPRGWTVDGASPLDYMASMQQPDGSILWKADNRSNDVWMTAYCAPAFAGHPLPIARVARVVKPDKDVTDPNEQIAVPVEEDPVEKGRGGTQKDGKGNTIVGGGAGAPLFSKPIQGSRGRTPGAPRRTLNSAASGEAQGIPEGGGSGGADVNGMRTTSGGDGEISGVVIGRADRPPGALRDEKAAPGPRSASIGGAIPRYAYAICALLLLGLGLGGRLELSSPVRNPFWEVAA